MSGENTMPSIARAKMWYTSARCIPNQLLVLVEHLNQRPAALEAEAELET